MERFIITGGTPLQGDVKIDGAKNAVLPILAASLLSDGVCEIHNVPLLDDVLAMCTVLRYYGAELTLGEDSVLVDASHAGGPGAPEYIMKKMRASNLVLGPLLSRFHRANLPYPGGCAIGSRPMNYHLQGLVALGATITEQGGYIEATVEHLRGTEICLDFPSVGATENVMMAAVLADGDTIIHNAAREPEIADLAGFLNAMGAQVKGAGSGLIQISGVKKLHGCIYHVMPDRIETGTLLAAATITGGDILLRETTAEHSTAVIGKLEEIGANISLEENAIRLKMKKPLQAVDITTMPYPGFPTDMQPQMLALLTKAQGTSIVIENIFENRFQHVDELCRLGADIRLVGRGAVINGKENLVGALVRASDLRAGAALVIAGLAAAGSTVVENVEYIDRGYQCLERTLQSLGADIVRVSPIFDMKRG